MKMMAFRLTFDFLMLAFFAAAFLIALDFRRLAATFPLVAAGGGVVMVTLVIARDIYATTKVYRGDEHSIPDVDLSAPLAKAMEDDTLIPTFIRFSRYVLWLGAFVLLTWILSFPLGSFLFVGAFLHVEADMHWRMGLLASVLTVVSVILMVEVLNLRFPPSLWTPVVFPFT